MTERVLSSEQSRTAITQMQSILSGQFDGTVQNLLSVGATLSDPNVWDGQVAANFRNTLWPQVSSGLKQAQEGLQQLQQQISKINENIMQAGGN
jgi:X-X-X-Leu-X-X-Gly heptad repeat protein